MALCFGPSSTSAPAQQQGFARINATDAVHPYDGGPWPVGHGIGYADCFVIEVKNFLSAIVQEKEYHPDFNDGLAVQKVLDAVERSAHEKKWMTL